MSAAIQTDRLRKRYGSKWALRDCALDIPLRGGGIFTLGFPLTLTNTSVKHNAPDDCTGC